MVLIDGIHRVLVFDLERFISSVELRYFVGSVSLSGVLVIFVELMW